MVIYKTTNLINGKYYVGKDARNRKTYYGSGFLLKLAIKKHGKSNFKKETLEVCNDLEHLALREIYWIKKLNAIEDGYNLTEGGSGGDTRTHGVNHNGGFPKGNVPWNKGIECTSDMKKKISETKKSQHLGGNSTSFKSGKDHVLYGTTRDSSIYDKVVATRKANGSYMGYGMKSVIHIESGKIFESIKEASNFYDVSRDIVRHSCHTNWKGGKFKFKDDDKKEIS